MNTPVWLKKAESQVGYHEAATNRTKFGRYFDLDGEPWCAMFVSWACATSGRPLPSLQPGMKSGFASVWYGMQYAKANGLWLRSWDAKPGDAVVYGWDGPGSAPANMHVGLVVSSGVKGSTGHTVEGNRGDQVGRFTFTVGEDVVLGCIDLNRLLLGRPKVIVTPKPDPQPRNPAHPAHTGPSPKHISRSDAGHLVKRAQDGNAAALDRLHIKPKPAKEPTVNLGHYKKSIVAVIGAVGTWALAALPDGTITSTEWTALGVAIATSLGVYQAKNKAKAKR